MIIMAVVSWNLKIERIENMMAVEKIDAWTVINNSLDFLKIIIIIDL